jgi:TPR repeat protein
MFWEGYGYDKGITNNIPVEKDKEAAVYHLDMAAIGGHPHARYILGCIEKENANMERAVRHLIIGANLGCDDSMKALWKHYSDGNITKEDLDATLRAHKAAVELPIVWQEGKTISVALTLPPTR